MSTYQVFERVEEKNFTVATDSNLPFRLLSFSTPIKTPIYYSDLNSDIQRDKNGIVVYDDIAVNKQIENVLMTPLGSDDFEPTFGSLIYWRLFEPITSRMAWMIRNDTIEAVQLWLKGRITLDISRADVSAITEDYDQEGYIVNLPYTIIKTKVQGYFYSAIIR